MQIRCARFPMAGLGPRGSVSGLRRRFGSGAGYQVPAFKKRAHGVCILLFIREGSTASLSNCLMA
jgi:hypothetical protein